MVENALWKAGLAELELLFIENVGNLVCPTSYDLGEDAKIVVLSVTEGEDKPLKYPGIFRKAELMILNKIDLLPHVPFRAGTGARERAPHSSGYRNYRDFLHHGSGFDRLDGLAARDERKEAAAMMALATFRLTTHAPTKEIGYA